MAAQRRSLLQSVSNRPALRAGGWEPGGAGGRLSGAGAAPSSPGDADFSLAGCDRRPPLSRAGPPHSLGWGRVRPREACACALRARPACARMPGPSVPERQGRVEGGSVLEPERNVARGCGESTGHR